MQRIQLEDGGLILFDECFFEPDVAQGYFKAIESECQWEQKPGIFGHMQPRLIASCGDPGVSYKYSGVVNVASDWTATLLQIKTQIEAVCIDGQQALYNYCLLNLYRNGQDSMGWHADDEPEMGHVIGSVSLGAPRKFRIRHNASRRTEDFVLGHGSLLIMAGNMQQHWQHEVPKTKRPVGKRINLTYRMIHQWI
ncbi:MAG: alpha-ketoglutarate-dependent dioxygenase AlkB family protein [Planctomycetota bacterium]|jgi:alkylated DNA repair dioxygenase AlkB